MKFRPLKDNIVIEQREADKVSEGGIHMAGAKEKPLKGDVIATGPGRYIGNVFVETIVQVGDVVLFGNNAGEQVEVDFDTLVLIMKEAEILAVVDG